MFGLSVWLRALNFERAEASGENASLMPKVRRIAKLFVSATR